MIYIMQFRWFFPGWCMILTIPKLFHCSYLANVLACYSEYEIEKECTLETVYSYKKTRGVWCLDAALCATVQGKGILSVLFFLALAKQVDQTAMFISTRLPFFEILFVAVQTNFSYVRHITSTINLQQLIWEKPAKQLWKKPRYLGLWLRYHKQFIRSTVFE